MDCTSLLANIDDRPQFIFMGKTFWKQKQTKKIAFFQLIIHTRICVCVCMCARVCVECVCMCADR